MGCIGDPKIHVRPSFCLTTTDRTRRPVMLVCQRPGPDQAFAQGLAVDQVTPEQLPGEAFFGEGLGVNSLPWPVCDQG